MSSVCHQHIMKTDQELPDVAAATHTWRVNFLILHSTCCTRWLSHLKRWFSVCPRALESLLFNLSCCEKWLPEQTAGRKILLCFLTCCKRRFSLCPRAQIFLISNWTSCKVWVLVCLLHRNSCYSIWLIAKDDVHVWLTAATFGGLLCCGGDAIDNNI